MMKKDSTIVKLIEKLKKSINFSTVEIVDHWQADLCAIGLKKGNHLVYISTFNHSVNNQLGYDFDFEILDESNANKVNVVSSHRNIPVGQLIDEIGLFLKD